MEAKKLDIREKLEKTLHRRLSEPLWNKLAAGPWIEGHLDYLDGNEFAESWEELRKHVATELKYEDDLYSQFLADLAMEGETRQLGGKRRTIAPSKSEPGRAEVEFAPWETTRALAHTEHVAGLADRNLHVKAFRAKVLGEAYPLTEREAFDLVDSPAAAFLSREQFEAWRIPIVGHSSQIEGEYFHNKRGEDVDHRANLIFYNYFPSDASEGSPLADKNGKVRIRYAAGGTPDDEEIDAQISRVSSPHDPRTVLPPKPDYVLEIAERPKPAYIWPGSILAQLKWLSKKLSKLYWKSERGEEEAAWFVLTGQPTFVPPLEVEARLQRGVRYKGAKIDLIEDERPTTADIILTVQAWMPADRVRDIYRETQRQIVGEARQPWERNLRAYTFVKSNGLEDREGESEPHRMYESQASQGEGYRSPHGFWQAYRNAKEKVEDFPYRKPPWYKPLL